jgi:hypothetical protein
MNQVNQKPDRLQPVSSRTCAAPKTETMVKDARTPGHFSVVPLLLFNRDISVETRRALAEDRLYDAAEGLMQEHGLSCIEASDLLQVSAC